MQMRYGSVCSGIEAATAAWHSLGWKPAFFSEIEEFPRQVLAHHYPSVPCHGDFTTIGADEYGSIDLLVGGTPCQSFSIAGLRKGMDDDRGNLALEFIRLAQRKRPKWIVWENVPGVLSSNGGRDFGTFLGALGEIGYGFAYRVLDAQYFGVAQRRRRVFVVGYLGDWRCAAAVLFERESLFGNPPPSRKKGEKPAPSVTTGAPFSRTGNERVECDAYVPTVANCLQTTCDDYSRADGFNMVAFPSNANADAMGAVGKNISPTMQAQGAAPAVCAPLNTQLGLRGPDTSNSSREGVGIGNVGDPSFTLLASDSHAVIIPSAARRLTPVECERLQGFPDNFTRIPYRNKPAENCPDGPRYKALGNSMAVPVMRWIGQRIQNAGR